MLAVRPTPAAWKDAGVVPVTFTVCSKAGAVVTCTWEAASSAAIWVSTSEGVGIGSKLQQ
ncbi:hypothetical protein CROQUDRAFT_100149 [Cronartium quercuum f. sp. fusiforme G11]|uniref:Uncharacterized protein n=1 Tax=Cronartium quercuum f. sp. fusiforme G11 TaxID=708437 RepID=A0A9P6T636_9BASI|nr:hypothetical protein CROQUDRAFT_100149 [Cronartium quercuum f. sp. fusiforme G11]